MKIYNYDRETKLFTGASEADADPMQPGDFLIPAFATHIQPPALKAGQVAMFHDQVQTPYWSVEKLVMTESGEVKAATTLEERVVAWRQQVRGLADSVARYCGFDDMAEAVTYADEPSVPKFQILGAALRAWRSVLWAKFEADTEAILANKLAEYESDEAMLASLPKFEMPNTEPQTEEPAAEPTEPAQE